MRLKQRRYGTYANRVTNFVFDAYLTEKNVTEVSCSSCVMFLALYRDAMSSIPAAGPQLEMLHLRYPNCGYGLGVQICASEWQAHAAVKCASCSYIFDAIYGDKRPELQWSSYETIEDALAEMSAK